MILRCSQEDGCSGWFVMVRCVLGYCCMLVFIWMGNGFYSFWRMCSDGDDLDR